MLRSAGGGRWNGAPRREYAVLIPAYNPDGRLVDIVAELVGEGRPVMVVDDGSAPESADVFDRVARQGAARIVRHPRNLGKGCALKTGLRLVYEGFPDLAGVVTMDADGQHAVPDACRVGARIERAGRALVVGVRRPSKEAPLRSRLGNACTRRLFAAITGLRLRDTQTGLRGVPRGLVPELLSLEGTRYEYEMAVLLHCVERGIPLVEEPVETRYFERNRSSHFRPWRDSLRIYRTLAGRWLRRRREGR